MEDFIKEEGSRVSKAALCFCEKGVDGEARRVGDTKTRVPEVE